MAVLNREEFTARVKAIIGERTDDEALAAVQDLVETFDGIAGEESDWKKKYEENDREWRIKYRDAFFTGKPDKEPEEEKDDHPETDIKIEDLFDYKED